MSKIKPLVEYGLMGFAGCWDDDWDVFEMSLLVMMISLRMVDEDPDNLLED